MEAKYKLFVKVVAASDILAAAAVVGSDDLDIQEGDEQERGYVR